MNSGFHKRKLGLYDVMPIGKKYKGKTLDYIARIDPQYISWFRKNVKQYELSNKVWSLAVAVGIAESEYKADQYGTAGDFGFPEF